MSVISLELFISLFFSFVVFIKFFGDKFVLLLICKFIFSFSFVLFILLLLLFKFLFLLNSEFLFSNKLNIFALKRAEFFCFVSFEFEFNGDKLELFVFILN